MGWWASRDLNPEPIGYEPTALTIELKALVSPPVYHHHRRRVKLSTLSTASLYYLPFTAVCIRIVCI